MQLASCAKITPATHALQTEDCTHPEKKSLQTCSGKQFFVENNTIRQIFFGKNFCLKYIFLKNVFKFEFEKKLLKNCCCFFNKISYLKEKIFCQKKN